MLHIYPKSFLKSFSRLENPWTSRSFGGFGFRFGLLFPCLADRPRGARRLSAWSSSSRCSWCSSRVLERFGIDPVGQLLFTKGCLADRPPGRCRPSARHELLADRPRTWYGLSACRGAGWVVLFVFNRCDNPPRKIPYYRLRLIHFGH
jgi:hypothetical protein